MLSDAHQRVCVGVNETSVPPLERGINARLGEHTSRETEIVVRRTQGAGCATGGVPTGFWARD